MHPNSEKVTKRDNRFQRLQVIITNREKRGRYGEFLVEGFNSLKRIIEFNWTIRFWVYSSERGLSTFAADLIDSRPEVPALDLTPELLAELSEKELASEIMAVVEIPDDSTNRIRKGTNPLYVVFDRPQNPGNLGTNIRTCDAFGVDTAFVIGHSVDVFDPETVRASVGSLFAIPVLRRPAWVDVLDDLKATFNGNIQVVGTTANGTTLIQQCDFTKPTVLLIGNEKTGLSKALVEAADPLITIPQSGSATSLNVSCATSILLYEVQRQRAN